MQTNPLLNLVISSLEDLKAHNIKVLDVHTISSVTDIMVVASGNSNRQVIALANHVAEKAKAHHHRPLGMEGCDTGEWALVDLGDVVVHVMQPQIREFYQLEKLWSISECLIG